METQSLTRLCPENLKANREAKYISRTVVFVVTKVIAFAPGENVKNQNVCAGFRERFNRKSHMLSVRLASLHPL